MTTWRMMLGAPNVEGAMPATPSRRANFSQAQTQTKTMSSDKKLIVIHPSLYTLEPAENVGDNMWVSPPNSSREDILATKVKSKENMGGWGAIMEGSMGVDITIYPCKLLKK